MCVGMNKKTLNRGRVRSSGNGIGEGGVPAGLYPTMMDRRLSLPAQDWLQLSKFKPRKPQPKTKLR